MKRIKKKSGFALVECVIAIAVFTIMAMTIAMLINGSIENHKKNISEARALRDQREDIADQLANPGTPILGGNTADGLTLDFGPGINPNYIFGATRSDRAEGLELTKFDWDPSTSGGIPGGEKKLSVSLSSWVWESIVAQHNSGIAVNSPNCNVLRDYSTTNTWGSAAGAGIPAVSTGRLFAYEIPDSATINPANTVWANGSDTYAQWSLNKGSANRGARPSGPLVANMVEFKFNGDVGVNPEQSDNPDFFVLHVPTPYTDSAIPPVPVVGVVCPSDLTNNVWLETVDVKYKDPNTGEPLYYDIYMEKASTDIRFHTFSLALITQTHIDSADPQMGDMKVWLRLMNL